MNLEYLKDYYPYNIHTNRICKNLGLPIIVREEAEGLFIKVLKAKLTQGYSIPGMVCACIHHFSNKYYYISYKELAQQIKGLVGESKNIVKHIRKCYARIVRELELKPQPIDLLSLVPRYVSDAGLDTFMSNLVTKFLEQSDADSNFDGKDPRGVVAAAIYLKAKEKGLYLSQGKIAKITGVTDVTIRSRIEEFEKIV